MNRALSEADLVRLDLGDGPVLDRGPVLGGGGADPNPGPEVTLFAIGLDIARRRVRAFAPGRLILAPAPGHALARLYHSAASQPGTSGGALVDGFGRLVRFVASGGEGHNEAIPAGALEALLAERGPAYAAVTHARGAATRACIEALEHAARSPARPVESLELNCPESGNRQLVDLAAQTFGRAARHDRAIALFERGLAEDPNAINARIGLAVTLQLARHYEAAAPHLTWLLDVLPDNLQVLRMATLSGKWGGDAALGARAFALIETHHPLIAPSAKKFLNDPSAAPARRRRRSEAPPSGGGDAGLG